MTEETKEQPKGLLDKFMDLYAPLAQQVASFSPQDYAQDSREKQNYVLKQLGIISPTSGVTTLENTRPAEDIIMRNGSKDQPTMDAVEQFVNNRVNYNPDLGPVPVKDPNDPDEYRRNQMLEMMEINRMFDGFLQADDFALPTISVDQRSAYTSHLLSKPHGDREALAKKLVSGDLKALEGLDDINAFYAGFDPEAQMEDLEVPANIAAGVDGVPDLFTGKVRAAVDTLMLHESGELFADNPYNAWNRGAAKVKGKTIFLKPKVSGKPIAENNIENLTLTEHIRRNKLGADDPQRLFAVGKYQIIPSTAKLAFKNLGLPPDTKYSKEIQDEMFNWIINNKQKEIGKYLRGEPDGDRNKAIRAFAAEFASGGIPKDETIRGRFVKKGGGVYGGQNAKTSPETVGKALDVLKEKYQE